MMKWCELSIVITMIKNDYKSFDMNINKSTPPSIYIPTYLPTHQHTYHFLPIKNYFKITIQKNDLNLGINSTKSNDPLFANHILDIY
jgi:uncharacterized protein (DUF362 family)